MWASGRCWSGGRAGTRIRADFESREISRTWRRPAGNHGVAALSRDPVGWSWIMADFVSWSRFSGLSPVSWNYASGRAGAAPERRPLTSWEIFSIQRHGRACPGHPRTGGCTASMAVPAAGGGWPGHLAMTIWGGSISPRSNAYPDTRPCPWINAQAARIGCVHSCCMFGLRAAQADPPALAAVQLIVAGAAPAVSTRMMAASGGGKVALPGMPPAWRMAAARCG
jgi:hypothetical protein